MPAAEGCNAPIVPAHEISSLFEPSVNQNTVWLDRLAESMEILGVFLVAYLFGALMAVGAIARLLGRRRWATVCAIALLTYLFLVCLGVLAGMLLDQILHGPWWAWQNWSHLLGYLAFLIAPFLILVYLLVSVRLRPYAFLSHMFAGTLAAFVWFGYWTVPGLYYGGARYGLHLSFLSSVVLLIGAVGEARALTGQTWRRTLWQLLTCRLRLSKDWQVRCPGCDYLLYGLTEMRCPECGRPFTFEELGVSPETLYNPPFAEVR